MAIDYEALRTRAATLVAANGAACTFYQLNATPADVSQPWRGAADPSSDETEVLGSAVRVEPESSTRLGLRVAKEGFVKRSEAILIAAVETDVRGYDEVLFDGVRYNIEGVEVLKPAGVTLLYFVGIRR